MSNRTPQPRDSELVREIESLSPLAFADVHEADGKFVAWVFIPESYYATDVLFCEYGDTAVEAAQKIKDWWLDDMTATGALGDRRYQPHYNTCTLKYRFLPAWKMRT